MKKGNNLLDDHTWKDKARRAGVRTNLLLRTILHRCRMSQVGAKVIHIIINKNTFKYATFFFFF